MDQRVVILYDPDDINQNNNETGLEYQANQIGQKRERKYAYDFAFDKHISTQEIYDQTVRFALDGALSGFNATVFAYGATGTGKTYTMLGTETKHGIIGFTF